MGSGILGAGIPSPSAKVVSNQTSAKATAKHRVAFTRSLECYTALIESKNRTIGPNDLWSDDTSDARYKHHVKRPYAHSHEKLCGSDPLYDLVILTDWNWPHAQAGNGSAIFINQFRRAGYPTEGCIAFRRDHLHAIARSITPNTRLLVS
jgi:L,D-peptidoglycan transpeptidase YkuD (ErfK/YbiS/YcfS/YnhG family)